MGQDDSRKRTKTIGNGKAKNSKCVKRGKEYKIEGNYKKIRKATEEEYKKLKKRNSARYRTRNIRWEIEIKLNRKWQERGQKRQ